MRPTKSKINQGLYRKSVLTPSPPQSPPWASSSSEWNLSPQGPHLPHELISHLSTMVTLWSCWVGPHALCIVHAKLLSPQASDLDALCMTDSFFSRTQLKYHLFRGAFLVHSFPCYSISFPIISFIALCCLFISWQPHPLDPILAEHIVDA